MKIWYLGHSGFAIECDNDVALVFDFFNDEHNLLPGILSAAKHVYALVSHSHPDHYNQRIFKWDEAYGASFTYIISGELKRKLTHSKIGAPALPDGTFALRRGENFGDGAIAVHAFGSTDIGVSYLVEIDGYRIFHAGDLNNWHWSEESTPQEIKAAEGNYLAILRTIRQQFQAVDVAMFPVDPRIGGDFSLGARQFLSAIDVGHFIPMHQWGDFEQSCNFSLYRAPTGKYHCMRQGESINI